MIMFLYYVFYSICLLYYVYWCLLLYSIRQCFYVLCQLDHYNFPDAKKKKCKEICVFLALLLNSIQKHQSVNSVLPCLLMLFMWQEFEDNLKILFSSILFILCYLVITPIIMRGSNTSLKYQKHNHLMNFPLINFSLMIK